MAQRYVPNEVFLVCTDGMKKSQMLVKSQSTIKIANGKLAATINDRFSGNFFCAKMVIAGAIIGAIIAAVVIAATILSGGAVGVGLAMAIGAGAAAGGAVAGAGAALTPSICSLLTSGSDWMPVHPKVKLENQKALIEQSKIPCLLGGNVMIFYSEAAADEFTDLKVASTLTHVGGIILGSALLSAGVATVFTAGSSFFANIKMINGTFGMKGAFIYAGEGAAWLLSGYGASQGFDWVKGEVYQGVQDNSSYPMADYADGKTLENADKLTQSDEPFFDVPNAAGETDYVADASDILIKDHDPNISNYYDLEYERRTGIHTNPDGSVIEETELDRSTNRNPNSIQERNPTRTSTSNVQHQGDASGSYYNTERYDLEEGSQLDRTNLSQARSKGLTSLKNALPSPLELGIEAYNILTNMLLTIPIKDFEASLEGEAAARNSINVIETDI
ncbi:uncharacterized protein DUF4280 [Pedobacter psychrotolerans]|uniref:Uncharacterized protein DUF4280 n=1 Tax=Pedobacter psychrotolerans TaxID=1843235 RepID=A0A4R2HIQ9_9SPHI|nr:PAAR-like protein [Pedobacter psychrotolerans]TCO28616.1 uncharacterized protein DUF4280 [Pedobacter psychrotolerans]GGE50482.1 hypothetical protein GCM10011413_15930 [Pedobacter psychrotolerans]